MVGTILSGKIFVSILALSVQSGLQLCAKVIQYMKCKEEYKETMHGSNSCWALKLPGLIILSKYLTVEL